MNSNDFTFQRNMIFDDFRDLFQYQFWHWFWWLFVLIVNTFGTPLASNYMFFWWSFFWWFVYIDLLSIVDQNWDPKVGAGVGGIPPFSVPFSSHLYLLLTLDLQVPETMLSNKKNQTIKRIYASLLFRSFFAHTYIFYLRCQILFLGRCF